MQIRYLAPSPGLLATRTHRFAAFRRAAYAPHAASSAPTFTPEGVVADTLILLVEA